MGGISRRNRVRRQLGQLSCEPWVRSLQQILHSRIFQDHPKIPNEPRMGIETKQISQRLDALRTRPPIPHSHSLFQVHQRPPRQPIGPEFEMAGLMGCHDQVKPFVLLRSRIAPENCRQGNCPPIGADRRAHSGVRRRIRQGGDRHIHTTESFHEQLQPAGHLPERHPAQGFFDGRQRPLRFQGEVGAGALEVVSRDFHSGLEPVLEPRDRLRAIADDPDDFRTTAEEG